MILLACLVMQASLNQAAGRVEMTTPNSNKFITNDHEYTIYSDTYNHDCFTALDTALMLHSTYLGTP